jgi:sucrose-phosphate synthase
MGRPRRAATLKVGGSNYSRELSISSDTGTHGGLYLCLLSIHGLIRGEQLELGRDADTGGQTKYVVDLARALARQPSVGRVDLVTRRVVDSQVSADYALAEESLGPGARIVRIDCGPEEYLPKEQLWDYLDSFADNLFDYLSRQPRMPHLIHSHYADAGYVGSRLSNHLEVPLLHTGHSLGRDKRKRLLARGLSRDQIEQTYNIERRIEAEETVLANAQLVITSTNNEIEDQYGLYSYYEPRHMRVIPPGTDLQQFHPAREDEDFPFRRQLEKFFANPDKPIILALSRPDERKNILTLVEAYGESAELQAAANLLLVVGSRNDLREMDDGARSVLTNILVWFDVYDLYGRVALPKRHRPEEVPEIYRMVAASRGVFINPALTEPFGLTLLEAAASGLPVVATENGGPVDIIRNCRCGLLVDPLDKPQITRALLQLLGDRQAWEQAARNGIEGVREHYSWDAHATQYLDQVRDVLARFRPAPPIRPLKRGALRYRDRMIVSDLDQNLIGDPQALQELLELLQRRRKEVSFAIATGRRVDSALAVMKKHGIPPPDVLITSLGVRIQYGKELVDDDLWARHIDHEWSPRVIRQALDGLPGLRLQDRREQDDMKISYYYNAVDAPGLDAINRLLWEAEINATTTLSFGQFLDITPARASKGQALRFVGQRLDIPLDHILVAGGSGADEDMMRGNTLAVVVANRHHEELSLLPEEDNVFFARGQYARGLLEAVDHYGFFDLPGGGSRDD